MEFHLHSGHLEWERVVPGTSIIPPSSGHLLQVQILRPHPGEPAFSQGLWLILMCRQGKESSLRFSEYRCYTEHAHFGEEMAGINGEKLKADTLIY